MPANDFDFLFGKWRITNQRLLERLLNSNEWETFEATGECWALPRGLGNVDYFLTDHWDNFAGGTLRVFNPHTQQWSLSWTDNQAGVVFPPVIGSFQDGVGTFLGREELRGQPIIVRFIWSQITSTSARWEQAFSPDEGLTWEMNWVMEFTRVA